ncbi:hypothetical protein C1634_000665 [Chryseobacterium viscerum]|uniref:Pycsar effector protein domain-containing protein n=2 Tax=Chryseobacterium viscerum TaxID=1037377 RepID=A0A316WUU6_9FLAO|nr:hypothetical protein C1634_000665 [Chryseobacterium viscerum]
MIMNENLKFVLERCDHYIESIQSKSNLYIALNTFILTGVITLILSVDKNKVDNLMYFILVSMVIVSCCSIIKVLVALTPYLKTKNNRSLIFFGDVSKTEFSTFENSYKNVTEEEFRDDLICQVHSVSTGLSKKYKELNSAGRLVVVQFVLIIFWIFLYVFKNL